MHNDRQEKINFLANFAKERSSLGNIDWDSYDVSEDDLYIMMATEVVTLIEKCPDEHKLVMAMGSMTTLLVEMFLTSANRSSS